MTKTAFFAGAAFAALFTSPVSAAVVFNVTGAFSSGGTLTGTFTTNDALTQVIGINLMTTANGAFQATTYNNLATIDSQALPNSFRLTVTSGTVKQLQLTFNPALTLAGSAIGGNSFEAQQIQGAGNRTITGSVARATGAVPEPATWAMMTLGFGAMGFAMRRKKVDTRIRFA